MEKRVTIKEVAKHAGVSPATVSRVLNNYEFISQEKKEKVVKAIKELNFEPNEIARSLITKKAKTIGLVVDDISNPFFSEASKLVIYNARQLGYEVLIYDTSGEEDMKHISKFLMNRNVSGVLVGSVSRFDKSFEKLVNAEIPVVYFNRKPERAKSFSVTMDNKKATKMAIGYLVQKGHSRIAFIGGPFEFSTYHDRYQGYYESIVEFGLKYDTDIVLKGRPTSEDIQEFVTKILSSKNRPTAIIASSDQMAITVLAAIANNNFSVPEGVSVIGFDNITISSNPYIGLTTISQQKSKMLEIALDTLIQLIEKGQNEVPAEVIIQPKLITRKTT